MNDPRSQNLRSIEQLVTGIRGLRKPIQSLADRLRLALRDLEPTLAKFSLSPRYWTLVAHTDGLVRVRLFTEQNFNYIESLGLLSVTRYLFELVLWFKLMEQDERYGLVYYHELLEKQRRYYTDYRDHLTREILLLKAFGDEEQRLMTDRLEKAGSIPKPAVGTEGMRHAFADVSKYIDDKVARAFTLYGEQARTNGYGLQADLVERKVLPDINESVNVVDAECRKLNKALPADVRALVPERWNWRALASKVGMVDEYDFIYTYTSRLLHATPASLTTDKKNLEPDEVRVFLHYCHVRMLDVIDMAAARLRETSLPS